MSALFRLGQTTGAVGAAFGIAAMGAAVGLAAERYAIGRSLRGDDPYADEPFGALRGTPFVLESSDGVELHVEIDAVPGVADPLEEGEWPTVVFAHGYALNLDAWHFQRRDLAGIGRLVLWDQRSHGRSGRSAPEKVSIEQLGEDLEWVVEAVAPRGPVVLVGHSMGGMTVMALARRRPEWFGERVIGVGLVATSSGGMHEVALGIPGPVGRTAHRLAPGIVSGLARQPSLVERTRRAASDLGYVLTKRYSFGPHAPASLVEFTSDMNAATPIEVVSDFLPIFDNVDASDALADLGRVETVVIGAELDLLTPVRHARTIAAALPRARYVEVPASGHMVLLEQHELVTAQLRDLIGRAYALRAAPNRSDGIRAEAGSPR